MTQPGAQAVNVAMKGGGYYSMAVKGAKAVIDGAVPLVLEALSGMDLAANDRPFVMSDLGCADGGTSLAMVERVLQEVHEAVPERPVVLVYTDQPRNDYNALFQTLYGAKGTGSALAAIEGLSIMASATSFYRQILPPSFLDLGFSATAMHWLSVKPCDIADHVHATGAEGTERAAFAEQGRRDWETILLHRARELKLGGRLVLVNLGIDEAGRYAGSTSGQNIFDIMTAIWRRFLEEDVITAAEYRAMTLPQYYSTTTEFTGPLTDPESPVHKAGLRLIHVESRVLRCPFAAEFERHGDAVRFASDFIASIRSWNESIYLAALSSDRSPAERQDIIERYYGAYETMVREAPEGHRVDYVHIYLVICKT